ncbi:hypothetical protein [Pseudarthrobacter sp. AB1]|uniref:hypothetical protein n=1 Tax=Pseudarthrobacter sp. AB1 TaxID=2138309 RepID=UPI00186B805C|nr:hypothetical protein [Pseudarthrobacter sp. AB1]MBE4720496.1 hypothetical protein [Pseudarthrobacter sp. AB1]
MTNHQDYPLRAEAMDPSTSPARLDELTKLEGDRGDCDSDAGWCREFVATNPSASAETLTELSQDMNDFLARLGAARNPNTPDSVVRALTTDWNGQADAARARLGLPLKPADTLTRRLTQDTARSRRRQS